MELFKYFCDDSLKRDDDDKWNYLLEYAFERADFVEFNILYPNQEITPDVNALSTDLIEKGQSKNKIYSSGVYLRYKLSDRMKQFIKSKQYKDWYNYYLEDISFLKGGYEFLATITHENYIILKTTEKKREELKEKGFNFWCEWEVDPVQKKKKHKSNSLIKKIEDLIKKE